MDNKSKILRVLVGSRAHGLSTPESDYDYRGVFIIPTSEMLKVGANLRKTSWVEGNDDDTSWEIGHFLQLSTKSNPTILETYKAPIEYSTPLGIELRALFPHVWSSKYVRDAFIGYGLNQRKKFLENKDNRSEKYAVAYLRVLYQAYELLSTGDFPVSFVDTPVFETLKKWKKNELTFGEVIDVTKEWQEKVEVAYKKNPDKETDMDKINEFLLKVRKDNWK